MERCPVLAGLLLALSACGSQSYADEPDLAQMREAFGCEATPSPPRRRACEAIDRFEAAGPVTAYAESGLAVFLGRQDCSDDGTEEFNLVFSLRGLGPGRPPLEVDEAHRPPGVMVRGMSSMRPDELRRDAAARTMEALRQGEPSPGLTPEQIDDGIVPASWDQWAERLTANGAVPVETAESDGPSLLVSPGRIPAFWDDAKATGAFELVRQDGDELIVLQPPTGEGPAGGRACVERLFPLP